MSNRMKVKYLTELQHVSHTKGELNAKNKRMCCPFFMDARASMKWTINKILTNKKKYSDPQCGC